MGWPPSLAADGYSHPSAALHRPLSRVRGGDGDPVALGADDGEEAVDRRRAHARCLVSQASAAAVRRVDIIIHEIEGGRAARLGPPRRACDHEMGAPAQLQHGIVRALGDLAQAERGEPAGCGGNVAHADRDMSIRRVSGPRLPAAAPAAPAGVDIIRRSIACGGRSAVIGQAPGFLSVGALHGTLALLHMFSIARYFL